MKEPGHTDRYEAVVDFLELIGKTDAHNELVTLVVDFRLLDHFHESVFLVFKFCFLSRAECIVVDLTSFAYLEHTPLFGLPGWCLVALAYNKARDHDGS